MGNLFRIFRYDDKSIYSIIVFGKWIDLRQWYQIPDDNDNLWYSEYEISEILEYEPDLKYKKIPRWKTMFR